MKIGLMILLMITGFVILALPDSDERLFSISKDHGPALQDVNRANNFTDRIRRPGYNELEVS